MSELPLHMDLYKLQLNNFTEVTMFILTGFTEEFDVQVFLFLLFLAIVLSFLDAYCSTVVTPKILVNFLAKNKSILFLGCATQMFLACAFGTTECFLLAAMAYDRYVAIYNPLLYSVTMSPRVYMPLVTASYIAGILHATIHTVATFSLSFCGSNEIRHVFCDIPPLLAISCFDTCINQLLLFYFVGFIEIVTILTVLISYFCILLAILKMHSAEGRRKVFSTCGAHLTGVSIYHGTILFMYVRPSSSYVLEHDMIVSIFYTTVIPMLNPIIYSLRIKDVKEAMKKMFGKNQGINKVYFHTKK
uniref:Olfactory receptor family 5 subfamily T member 1 n=1 Tax=Callithrix jacchus TaxID=9483 RepID=A0A5F4W874_CALJA